MTTRHGTNPDPPPGSKPATSANPSDRNSEGAFTERHGVDLRGIRVGEVLTQDQWDAVCAFVIEQDRIIDGTAAEVQALVERMEKSANLVRLANFTPHAPASAEIIAYWRDELAQLIPRGK